jgi:hypothetical protein
LVERDNVGWQLTSEKTRVDENANQPLPGDLPKPVASDVSKLADIDKSGEFDAADIALKLPGPGNKPTRAPMEFSADGDWLYMIDADNVLRKISTANFQESAYLTLGSRSDEMASSREGLLVALGDEGAVWIVDEETLEVKRRIAVPGIHKVAGSRGSSLGFASSEFTENSREMGQLLMIDLVQGKPIHAVRTVRDGRDLMFGNENADKHLHSFRFRGLQLSPDGRYLYGGYSRIHRFRVDGQDLMYEQSTSAPSLVAGRTPCVVLSNDGKWVAMPTESGNVHGTGLAVFDTRDLANYRLLLGKGESLRPTTVGFDQKTGNMYTYTTSGRMTVFDPAGEIIRKFRFAFPFPRRTIVHPAGERFVMWGSRKVTYFDTVPGRLTKSIGRQLSAPP